MVKVAGMGSVIIVADSGGCARTISNDITNYDVDTPVPLQDTTGVNSTAMERLQLLQDMTVNFTGVFNAAANNSHDVFKTAATSTAQRLTTIRPLGSTAGCPELEDNLLYTGYNVTRAPTGELTWTTQGQLADGCLTGWGTV